MQGDGGIAEHSTRDIILYRQQKKTVTDTTKNAYRGSTAAQRQRGELLTAGEANIFI